MNREEQFKKFQKLVAKAWADDAFKQALLSNPEQTLRDAGIKIPKGVEIRAVENTDTVFHIVLPAKPSSDELGVEKVEARLAAGSACNCWFTASSC